MRIFGYYFKKETDGETSNTIMPLNVRRKPSVSPFYFFHRNNFRFFAFEYKKQRETML